MHMVIQGRRVLMRYSQDKIANDLMKMFVSVDYLTFKIVVVLRILKCAKLNWLIFCLTFISLLKFHMLSFQAV